ncbi:hypothetical protein OROGR_016415 [Orobanche gracilis]
MVFLKLFNMIGGDDSLQSISVRLDVTNYTYWNFGMKNFLKGKKMWKYISGDALKPLTRFDTDKEVWDYLGKLYVRSNFAVQYQLEADIRALVQTEGMSIEDVYNKMTVLWDQLAVTETAELRAFEPYIARREEQRLVQFLMALRTDFELMRGSILHRTPLPSVDSVVHELLAEETRLKTQTGKVSTTPNTSVIAASQVSDSSALVARTFKPPKNRTASYQTMNNQECAYCKEIGHWKNQCPKLKRERATQNQYRSGSGRGNFSGGHHQYNTRPNTAAFVPYSDHPIGDISIDPGTSLVDQFQKFLATQSSSQSHAMTASSSSIPPGLSTTCVLDSGASKHVATFFVL